MFGSFEKLCVALLVIGACLFAIGSPGAFGQDEPDVAPAAAETAPAAEAPAQPPAAEPPASAPVAPVPEVAGVVQAVQNGHWLVALGGVVMLLVAGARWLLHPKTRTAKLLLAGAVAALTTLGVAWQSGAGLSWSLVGTAFAAAWAAGGMSEHVKDVRGQG